MLGSDMNRAIHEFCKMFSKIRAKGYVASNRSHNTGVGKTFEDLCGLEENNYDTPDFHGLIEIKAKRALSSSMLTLFTKSPSYPPNANNMIRDKYGYPDEKWPSVNVLHTTISATGYNTLKNRYGFKLDVSEPDKKIFIRVKDIKMNKIIDENIYYRFEDLKSGVEKCSCVAYVHADKKKVNGLEMFHYKSAKILYGLTFERFIEAIKEGVIVYDFRSGAYKYGKNAGKPHDHGSGFRIRKNDIGKIYSIIDCE